MNRRNEREKLNYLARFIRLHRTGLRILLILGTVFVAWVYLPWYIYAKYYSVNAQKGVAVASGIYFSANHASEATENDPFVESLVMGAYQGGSTSFIFEVRNYENNLLFNKFGADISYTVSFWLEKNPENAVYYVRKGTEKDAEKKQLGEEENKIIFDGIIQGGGAYANEYQLDIEVSDGIKHNAVPIKVCVETNPGTIINRTLKGTMIIENAKPPESYIKSQSFLVPSEPSSLTEFVRLCEMSGFTYEIRTVGELSEGGTTQKILLSWDPNVLSVDLSDPTYSACQESNTDSQQTPGWRSILIDVMPYSSISVGFFRGPKFGEITSMEQLYEYIEAEKISGTE